MTTKLTLTIDDKVIHSAKKYALKQGKSLSEIVENYLIAITTTSNKRDNIHPRVKKLMGVIKLSKDFDYKKMLTKALVDKYRK